ncbi:hypothetical protein VTL71DRAFT_15685 [Oculimacula yallundae]|uniref:Uncharacterized protein n=1 Tax=Oculimacula yallundae TaxID=86028 RepID=A0ABR4CIN1_9HELO
MSAVRPQYLTADGPRSNLVTFGSWQAIHCGVEKTRAKFVPVLERSTIYRGQGKYLVAGRSARKSLRICQMYKQRRHLDAFPSSIHHNERTSKEHAYPPSSTRDPLNLSNQELSICPSPAKPCLHLHRRRFRFHQFKRQAKPSNALSHTHCC